MSKNLDETVRLQSEKRQQWIREIRGEIAEETSSAPHLGKYEIAEETSSAPHLGKYARATLVKRKRNRAVCTDHQTVREERVKERESHLGEIEGDQMREHVEERVDSTVKECRFRGGKGEQARRASLEQVEGSMSG